MKAKAGMEIRAAAPGEYAHVYGRTVENGEGVPLMWSSAGMEMLVRGTRLEAQIECGYQTMKPYLSFEVDGLRAQTFSPLPGRHWYNVFLNLDGQKAHTVHLIQETQPFAGDPESRLMLCRFQTDGAFLPVSPKKRRIEFIGDSITSAEGNRGPGDFMEWVPMMFGASDAFPRLTADALKADYRVVSVSGWGVTCGWDNDPASNLPRVYDAVCALTPIGQRPYDFAWQPDRIVIALGTNDQNAFGQPPFTDPVTGESHKLTDDASGRAYLEESAFRFLLHLHEKNPAARLFWICFFREGPMQEAVQRAVARAHDRGIDVQYSVPYDYGKPFRGSMGSRMHPGPAAHRRIAGELIRLLK